MSSGSKRERPPLPSALGVPLADSHTHLDLDDEVDQRGVGQIIADATSSGVDLLVHIGTDVPSSEYGLALTQDFPMVRCAVALHPNVAPDIADSLGDDALTAALEEIETLAKLPGVHAIGETGLDFFRTEPGGRTAQELSFREHIRIAMSVDKPLVVHDRDAHQEISRVLAETKPDQVVLHCFSGDAEMATEFARRGYFLSFAGNVTFKNAEGLREALKCVPLSQLLVETDAPFLTPVPYRGKVNSSYLIPLIVTAIAEIRGDSPVDVANATWQNTLQLFGDSP